MKGAITINVEVETERHWGGSPAWHAALSGPHNYRQACSHWHRTAEAADKCGKRMLRRALAGKGDK